MPLARVHVIWTVRTAEELDIFADTLFAAARYLPAGEVKVNLFSIYLSSR
jgi:hypothetical protein